VERRWRECQHIRMNNNRRQAGRPGSGWAELRLYVGSVLSAPGRICLLCDVGWIELGLGWAGWLNRDWIGSRSLVLLLVLVLIEVVRGRR
jgi:hypothetical protein